MSQVWFRPPWAPWAPPDSPALCTTLAVAPLHLQHSDIPEPDEPQGAPWPASHQLPLAACRPGAWSAGRHSRSTDLPTSEQRHPLASTCCRRAHACTSRVAAGGPQHEPTACAPAQTCTLAEWYEGKVSLAPPQLRTTHQPAKPACALLAEWYEGKVSRHPNYTVINLHLNKLPGRPKAVRGPRGPPEEQEYLPLSRCQDGCHARGACVSRRWKAPPGSAEGMCLCTRGFRGAPPASVSRAPRRRRQRLPNSAPGPARAAVRSPPQGLQRWRAAANHGRRRAEARPVACLFLFAQGTRAPRSTCTP